MKRDSTDNANNVLRELYKIASRRSHDSYEGLAIQLQDGLQTMACYWDMLVGVVSEVSNEQISVTDYYMRPFEQPNVGFANGNPPVELSENLDPKLGQLERRRAGLSIEPQLTEMNTLTKDEYLHLNSQMVEMKTSVCSLQNCFSAQLILAPEMVALNDTLPPPTTALSTELWDRVMTKVRRYIGIPLVIHDRHFGTLCFFSVEPSFEPFSDDDLELLWLFSEWIGSLLERMQSHSMRATEQSDLACINKESVQSNSDLDHFVYIASHDLKEPLRGIFQYAQFLAEDYCDQLDDKGKRMLTALIDQSQRIVKQIDDLRFYSRIGRHESGIDLVDLNDIITDVRAFLHTLLGETGVDIRIPRALPSIRGNAALITTVFQNLIANAARYNDKEHKWIQISWGYRSSSVTAEQLQASNGPFDLASDEYGCTQDDDDIEDVASVLYRLQERDAQIVLTIADNGIGIGERDRDAIFSMFRRLHGQDDYGGGTGAGLAIVKRILEKEGGLIWLDSTIGVGTQFHFTFERKNHF